MIRRILPALLATAAATLGPASLAPAYWPTTGAGTASGTTATFAAPASVAAGPSPSGGTVTVRWDAATLSTGGAATGYYVTRTNGATTAAACGSSAAQRVSALTCSDTGVPEGSWSYTVTAVYHSWTAASGASAPVTVDRTAPPAPALATPADGSYQQARTVVVSGTAEPRSSVQVLDGGTAAGVATADSAGAWTVTLTGLADGAHVLTARATDAAGNTSTASTSRTVTVDNQAPSTTITSTPIVTTTSTSATFTFTASESGSTFECALDGGAYTACSSPKSYSGLSFGSHAFKVRATDRAGNTDATGATETWTITNPTPDTSITGHPAALTNQTSASFTYAATIGGSTFECALDSTASTAWASCPATGRSYSGLTAAQHTFYVRATSNGNVDATPAAYTWTIDQTAPFGTDFTLVNSGAAGSTAGRIETNDRISVTYSEAMDPSSLVSGWDGSGSRSVKVVFSDSGSNDQITQVTLDTATTAVPLGTIQMKQNYIAVSGSANTVTFSASALTMAAGEKSFTIVLGTPDNAGAINTVTAASTMTWTPAAGARDVAGNATSTATVQKSMLGF